MSLFKRTRNGLKNQHLFYDVDMVVFLEGGESYSMDEVLLGYHHQDTEDILYWKNIFSTFKKSQKIKFKSVGSKSVIKELALDIIGGQLTTIMVAMDNEFDEILERRTVHPNIVYTYGYSYENDIWNSDVIKAVIQELTAVEIDNNIIEDTFNKFLKSLKFAVYADGYQFKKGASFFPRKSGYLFCIRCNSNEPPSVKKEEIQKKVEEKSIPKKSAYAFGRKNKIDTHKLCFGHLLADYCCQVISWYLKTQHNLNAPNKEILYRMGIKKYFEYYFSGGVIYMHHRAQLTVEFPEH